MCWCTPTIRTPFCGKAGCHPPDEQTVVGSSTTVTLTSTEGTRVAQLQAKATLTEGERIELTMLLNRRWGKPEATF